VILALTSIVPSVGFLLRPPIDDHARWWRAFDEVEQEHEESIADDLAPLEAIAELEQQPRLRCSRPTVPSST
jgi:hypothetical protein